MVKTDIPLRFKVKAVERLRNNLAFVDKTYGVNSVQYSDAFLDLAEAERNLLEAIMAAHTSYELVLIAKEKPE